MKLLVDSRGCNRVLWCSCGERTSFKNHIFSEMLSGWIQCHGVTNSVIMKFQELKFQLPGRPFERQTLIEYMYFKTICGYKGNTNVFQFYNHFMLMKLYILNTNITEWLIQLLLYIYLWTILYFINLFSTYKFAHQTGRPESKLL